MPNPWLSFWMSAANAWAGAIRGFWTAELQRQRTAMMNEASRHMVRFWTEAWGLPAPRRSASKRR